MQALLFFSRVVFICNVSFAAFMVLSITSTYFHPEAFGFVMILGAYLGLLLSFSLNLIIIVLLLLRKPIARWIPKWLVTFNMVFFIIQLIYFFR